MTDTELYRAALSKIVDEPIEPFTIFQCNGQSLKWCLDYSVAETDERTGQNKPSRAHITFLIEREIPSTAPDRASDTYWLWGVLKSMPATASNVPMHLVQQQKERKKIKTAKGSRSKLSTERGMLD